MNIYTQHKNQLTSLKEIPFKLEKDIQKVFEANLEMITGWKFIKSEFSIKSNRFDTLAYDEESKSFIIIEYKKQQNSSVVDQGITYLGLMLEYKADFIVEYNESQNANLKRADIDWSQSKVIFVSPSFTNFQKQASNFKDLPIALWEIKQFENDVIVINQLQKAKTAPSLKEVEINTNSKIAKITKEVKVYAEEDHLEDKSETIIELYEAFKNAIFQLGTAIELKPKKQEIGFTNNGKIFTDICILKSGLKIWINRKKGELDDPKHLMRDVSSIGHWGNGDYQLSVADTANLEYIMSLIKQAL